MNAQVIALVNQKGGVGKSTSCVNLGVGLAQAGKKVLLVDVAPQASLTISLGHSQPDNLPVTLSDMMGKVLNDQPIVPGEGILHHLEGVDFMPSDIQLSGMEVSLVNAIFSGPFHLTKIDSFALHSGFRHITAVKGSMSNSVAIICASTMAEIAHAESVSPSGIFFLRMLSYSAKAFAISLR